MVQATTPGQGAGHESRGGFRIGASHDTSTRAGSAPVSSGGRKLPPIVWAHVDTGKMMREDLAGVGWAVTVALAGMAVFIGTGMGIALVVTTVLHVLGFDPSSSY